MRLAIDRQLHPKNTWMPVVLIILGCLYTYQNIQRGLFADGVRDFNHSFHVFDSVLNSMLVPALLFLAGYVHHALIHRYQIKRTVPLAVNALLYPFVIWSLLQGVVEILFSGYTGGKETLLTLLESITYNPKTHLAVWLSATLCALVCAPLFNRPQPIFLLSSVVVGAAIYFWQLSNPVVFPLNLLAETLLFYSLGAVYAKSNLLPSKLRALLWTSAFLASQWFFHSQPNADTYHLTAATLALSIVAVGFVVETGRLITLEPNRRDRIMIQAGLTVLLSHVLFGFGIREVLQNSFAVNDANSLLFLCVATALFVPTSIALICNKIRMSFTFYAPYFLRIEILSAALRHYFAPRPITKWASIATVSLFGAAYATVVVVSSITVNTKVNAVIPPSHIVIDEKLVSAGERLATILGCAGGCHGNQLQGIIFRRDAFVGTWSSANLTKAAHDYSVAELDGIIRHGIHPNGTPIVHGMPSAGFSALTDSQLSEIISYLYYQPLNPNRPPSSKLGILTRWKIFNGDYQTEFDKATSVRAYYQKREMTDGMRLAHIACMECHGTQFEGNPIVGSPPLAITLAYTFDAFERLLNTGVSIDGRQLGLMGTVATSRFKHFTRQEKQTLFEFLRTLPLQ